MSANFGTADRASESAVGLCRWLSSGVLACWLTEMLWRWRECLFPSASTELSGVAESLRIWTSRMRRVLPLLSYQVPEVVGTSWHFAPAQRSSFPGSRVTSRLYLRQRHCSLKSRQCRGFVQISNVRTSTYLVRCADSHRLFLRFYTRQPFDVPPSHPTYVAFPHQ